MVLKLFLAALMVAGMANAQGKKGGGGGGNSMGENMPRPQRQSRMDMIADKLKLNKEQKDEVAKIFSSATEKAGPLAEQIRNGRGKMTELLIAGKNSGDDWDSLMKAFTGVLAQQEAIEADAYGKMYALLDEKQKPKAGPVFEELMAGMLTRGGGGGGGDRGRQ